jgi:predicted esterase
MQGSKAPSVPRGRGRALLTLLAVLFAGLSSTGSAAQLYEQFPADIHPAERYVIFSHGFIAEGDDPKPVSPQFGVYDFPALKQALFAGGGYNLIAVQRKKGLEVEDHARQLESWVHQLIKAGVQPSRITLVGFSRGSMITGLASSHLVSEGINTALLAICSHGDLVLDSNPPLKLGGNFLSIYETSDQYGSCAQLAARSHLVSFKEVAISTGKAHGAFFVPRPVWVDPLKAWIANTNR